jgi:hypothetical protein
MKKHLLLTLTLMLLVTGSAMWISISHASPATVISGPSLDNDAAYRDGLFQGKQSAERNAARHAPIGRWSAKADWAAFTKGFERAYRSRTLDELVKEESY